MSPRLGDFLHLRGKSEGSCLQIGRLKILLSEVFPNLNAAAWQFKYTPFVVMTLKPLHSKEAGS